MIDLYTWGTANGRIASIALEEFGCEYVAHAVDIGNGEQSAPSFLKISPNGKIPAIHDHETGRTLMESAAILLYLAERHDRFRGDDRWQTVEWLMLQAAGIGPILGEAHRFLYYNRGKAPFAETHFAAEAKRLYALLDQRVADRGHLAGPYSIADMATWPWVSRYAWQDIDLADYPSLTRWYLEIADRPAVQRGYDVPTPINPIPRPRQAPHG